MKNYFVLQYKMTNRKLREAGLHPLIGYILSLAVFILILKFMFQKTGFAKYLVLLISMSLLIKLSTKNRTEFLLTTFGNSKTRKIRIVENLIISLPFLIVLIFKNAYLESAILFAFVWIFASISFKNHFSITLPTPFYKHPFEFVTGFRKTFYIFPIAYILTIIAISVGNFNLGIFAMILVFLTSLSYYNKPENEYYIWVHSYSSGAFIFYKLKTAIWHSSILSFPVLIALMIFFFNDFETLLFFYAMGLLFLCNIILAKYAAYPNEMNLPEGVLLAISIYFPPLLIALIPFFYIRSVKKIKVLLND